MTEARTLSEHLDDAYDVPEDEEERARFVIDGPGKADWALRKLGEIAAQQDENARLAAAEITRVRDWLANDPQNTALERDQQFFEALLTEWWRGQLAKMLADVGGDWSKLRTKSRNLPHGTVAGRYSDPVPVYDDEEAAVEWFKSHDLTALVAVVEKPKKAEVKDAIRDGALVVVPGGRVVDPETGEPVPGVSMPEVADLLDEVNITVKPKGSEAQ